MNKILQLLSIALLCLSFGACTMVTATNEHTDSTASRQNSTATDANLTGYELPLAKDKKNKSLIIKHKGFTLSFNCQTLCPDWVAWCLTKEEATTKKVERTNYFQADTQVPSNCRVEYYDYSKSGYDRGHMVPAADMRWDKQAMEDCFLMSNMCPQHHDLNEGDWNSLEMACRRWAKAEGAIYIACGPIFEEDRQPDRIGRKRIAVPDHFFKVVMTLTPGNERAIGFIFQNTTGVQFMKDCAVSVDEVEKITGYDFFASVPRELQERIEAQADFKEWNN